MFTKNMNNESIPWLLYRNFRRPMSIISDRGIDNKGVEFFRYSSMLRDRGDHF